jgi:hypothetical protein
MPPRSVGLPCPLRPPARLRHGVDVSSTSDGRRGGRLRSPASLPLHPVESRSRTASARLRETGAVDVMMRQEQEQLRREIAGVEGRLRNGDATLAQWQEILDIAMRFAHSCGTAYRVANERSRTLYNRAVFGTLIVRDGCIAKPRYAAPFGLVLGLKAKLDGCLGCRCRSVFLRHRNHQQPRIEATRHLRRGRAGRRAWPSQRRSGR